MRTLRMWVLPTEPATMELIRASGASLAMIRAQLDSGRLLRLRHGVYLAASAWPSDEGAQHVLLAHAEVAANPEAVLSHQSAAQVLGLPAPGFTRWSQLPVAVTLPAGRTHSARTRTAVHHVAALPREQVSRDAAGYPLTSPARTGVDLAAGLELPQQLVILDAVARLLCEGYLATVRRSDFVNPRLVGTAREELLRVSATRKGCAVAQAVALVDPARESAAESLSAGHFEAAGLPRPRCQARIATASGTFYPDFLWEARRLIGECDGAVKYERAEAYVAEKQREQALRDAGYRIVRWLAKETLTSPDVVVGRVAAQLGS